MVLQIFEADFFDFMNNYLVALGSNLASGQLTSLEILQEALVVMSNSKINVISVSAWWQSNAFPPSARPNYINGVAKVSSTLNPQEALQCLKEIEILFGRKNSKRWGNRVLDLDLLACGSMILPNKLVFKEWLSLSLDLQKKREPTQLILPHPRIQDRLFVLKPLVEVFPDWVHPVLGKNPQELIDDTTWDSRDLLKLL